jgi:anti-sigma B factor antagonist
MQSPAPPHELASGTVIIAAPQSLDAYSATGTRDQLREAIEQASADTVILDLVHAEYIDIAGLGVIAAAHNHARRHDRIFAVACTREPLLRKFRITGLNHVVDIRDSADESQGHDHD